MRIRIKRLRRAAAVLLAAAVTLCCGVNAAADSAALRQPVSDEAYRECVESAVAWELGRIGGSSLSEAFISAGIAGSAEADWFMLAEKSLGLEDSYELYAGAAGVPDISDGDLLTEPARRNVTLALLGGRGEDMSGAELDGAGCNEVIWVILAQRLNGYDCSEALEILEDMQQEDGGFGLSDSDADITAMALTVLEGEPAERAEQWLASRYDGSISCETAAWYIIGACSRGTDIANSTSFIDSNGRDPVELLMDCRCVDGGFSHFAGGESGAMATAQALTALAALAEFNAGGGGLFDGKPGDVDIYSQQHICGSLSGDEQRRLARITQLNAEIRAGYYPPGEIRITHLPELIELNDRIEALDPADREYVLSAKELAERERVLKRWSLAGIIFGVVWKTAAFIALLRFRKTKLYARLREQYDFKIFRRSAS